MMADEADQRLATDEEKRPINSVDQTEAAEAADPEVKVLPASQNKKQGCFMTRKQAYILGVFVVLLLIIVASVVGILTRSHYCPNESDEWDFSDWGGPKPTVAPGYPWSGIRLPESLTPSFYDIDLRVDLDTFKFNGSVSIDVKASEETRYIILHSSGLNIDQSKVSVRDIQKKKTLKILEHIPVPINQFWVLELEVDLVSGRRYRISFGQFSGTIGDDLRGLYRSSYRDESGKERWLAASQLQSVDARKVFPCFDEPDLKANFSVSLTTRPEYDALSNMPDKKTIVLDNGWQKTQYETTPIMSTYLLAFVIADFEHREAQTDHLLIRIWAQPDSSDQTTYALQFAGKAYDFFADYFGTPEVVPKADHVAIPDFSAGAMENWGLVLYRETALLHDDDVSSIANKFWVSLIMAHEIAHTWFGNMVTMRWWDDLWLNEGFANTLMYFALDKISPTWKVLDLQLVNNIYTVMTKDSLLTSHAISTPIIDPDDIPQYFDSISYDKGMAVLRLLRGFLGWEDFKKGLQRYISKYKYSNAEMSELWQTFTETVKNKYDVGQIMDTWTRQMGFPVVSLRKKGPGRYALEQKRFLLNPEDHSEYDTWESEYGYKWRIPFTYRIQGEMTERTTWMNLDSAEITIPDGAWVLGNFGYMGFYRTNYDDEMWRLIIAQLNKDHSSFSPANRAGLINDAFNLARANMLNYKTALNLTTYLEKERDYVPWKAFLDAIDFLKGMLATSNSYGKLRKYIYDLVAPQYRRVGTSDQGELLERNLRRAMLEAAAAVNVPDAIEWAERTFDAWKEYGTRVPPDYALVVFSVGIQKGGEEAWNFLWEKSRTSRVASEAEVMMNALAYAQEPWLLWRYARWSLDSTKIRMQDLRNLFRYFASTPLGRSVALQFLLTNWREINKRFGMDAFLLRDIIYATTSLISTEYELKQLERLYKESPPAGVARKAAENSLALVRSNINWMKLHQGTIEKWLNDNIPDEEIDNTM